MLGWVELWLSWGFDNCSWCWSWSSTTSPCGWSHKTKVNLTQLKLELSLAKRKESLSLHGKLQSFHPKSCNPLRPLWSKFVITEDWMLDAECWMLGQHCHRLYRLPVPSGVHIVHNLLYTKLYTVLSNYSVECYAVQGTLYTPQYTLRCIG